MYRIFFAFITLVYEQYLDAIASVGLPMSVTLFVRFF